MTIQITQKQAAEIVVVCVDGWETWMGISIRDLLPQLAEQVNTTIGAIERERSYSAIYRTAFFSEAFSH